MASKSQKCVVTPNPPASPREKLSGPHRLPTSKTEDSKYKQAILWPREIGYVTVAQKKKNVHEIMRMDV